MNNPPSVIAATFFAALAASGDKTSKKMYHPLFSGARGYLVEVIWWIVNR